MSDSERFRKGFSEAIEGVKAFAVKTWASPIGRLVVVFLAGFILGRLSA